MDDWTNVVRAIQTHKDCTPVGSGIATNLVKVAATRIFEIPEQSIIELVVNSIDASTQRRPVGKFGMGFYSIVYWLHKHPGRVLRITSVFGSKSAKCGYSLQIYEDENQRLSAKLDVFKTKARTGTRVEIDATKDEFSERNVREFGRQMKRLSLIPDVALVKSPNKGSVCWNDSRLLKRDALPVLVEVSPQRLVVEDYGPGIPVSTALSSLLTPSLSTKTVQASFAKTTHVSNTHIYKDEEKLPYSSDETYSIIVVVNHVIVYLNPESALVVAIVDMPPWTPVPVSRDNIIVKLDNKSEFETQITKLTQGATRSSNTHTFLKLEQALREYDMRSRQAYVTNVVDNAVMQVYINFAPRIVLKCYIHLYNFDLRLDMFAGTSMNSVAVKRHLVERRVELHDNIFFGRQVVFTSTESQKSTGGLDDVVFVSQAFKNQHSDWKQKLCNDYTLGFGLRVYSTKSSEQAYEQRAQECLRASARHAWMFRFKNETMKEVVDEWNHNEQTNFAVLRMIYDRIHDSNMVEFEVFKPGNNTMEPAKATAQDVLELLVYLYGIYRQKTWLDLACTFRDACLTFSPPKSYGERVPAMYIHKMYTQNAQAIQLMDRPINLDFDAELVKYVFSKTQSNNLFSLLTPVSLSSYLVEASTCYKIYEPTYNFVRSLPSSMNSKVCLLSAVGYLSAKDPYLNSTFDQKRLEHWIRSYIHVFDKEITPSYVACIRGVRGHIYHNVNALTLIFGQHIQVWQAALVFQDWVRKLRTRTLGLDESPQQESDYKFTTNQLISKVMSDTHGVNAKNLLESINEMSERTSLQMLGIVVNEGNTRPFVVAVLQELIQNAIDVIRDSRVKGAIDLSFMRSGNNLVVCIHDPVGMNLETLFKMNIPFYSGKATSKSATGEMGTGYFNVFRETTKVVVTTCQDEQTIVWTSTPVLDKALRVVDIENTVQVMPGSTRGTTIKLYCKSDLDVNEQAVIFEASMRHLFSVVDPSVTRINLDHMPLNVNEHTERSDVNNGDIRISEHGFQRGNVVVTRVSDTLTSYVLTNGVPFMELEHFCKVINFGDGFRDVLCTGFVIDLPKESYTAVQSREKIQIRPDVLPDLLACLKDCCWIACIAKLAKDVENPNPLFWNNDESTYLETAFKCKLLNYTSRSSIDQTLPNESKVKYETLFGSSLCDVIHAYRVFSKIGQEDNLENPTFVTWLRDATKVLLSRTNADKGEMARFAAKQVSSTLYLCVRRDVAKVLFGWLLRKEKAQSVQSTKPKVRHVYEPSSNAYKLVKTFIDVYVQYGTDKQILGFSQDMIKQVCVQYDEDEKSSWFDPKTREVVFTENMHGHDQGIFDLVAETVRLNCNTASQNATMVSFEEHMNHSTVPEVTQSYINFFNMRIGTVLHEVEHARRNKTVRVDNTCGDGGHPDLNVSFCTEPSRNLSFNECFKEAGQLVSNHEIYGVSFIQALVSRWKQELQKSTNVPSSLGDERHEKQQGRGGGGGGAKGGPGGGGPGGGGRGGGGGPGGEGGRRGASVAPQRNGPGGDEPGGEGPIVRGRIIEIVVPPVESPSNTKALGDAREHTSSNEFYEKNKSHLGHMRECPGIRLALTRGKYGNDAVVAAKFNYNFDDIEAKKTRLQQLVDLQNDQISGATMTLAIITWRDKTPVLTAAVLGNNPIVVYTNGVPVMGVLDAKDAGRKIDGDDFHSLDYFFGHFHELDTQQATHRVYTDQSAIENNQTLTTRHSIGNKNFNVQHDITWKHFELQQNSSVVIANNCVKKVVEVVEMRRGVRADNGYWYDRISEDELLKLTQVKDCTTQKEFSDYHRVAKACVVVTVSELTPGQTVLCGVFSCNNGDKVTQNMLSNLDKCLTTNDALPSPTIDNDYLGVHFDENIVPSGTNTRHEPEACVAVLVDRSDYEQVLQTIELWHEKANQIDVDLDAKITADITKKLQGFVFLKSHIANEIKQSKLSMHRKDITEFKNISGKMRDSITAKYKLSKDYHRLTSEDKDWNQIVVCRDQASQEFRSIAFYGVKPNRCVYIAYLLTHVDNIRGSATQKRGASKTIMDYCNHIAKESNISLTLKPVPNAEKYYLDHEFVLDNTFGKGCMVYKPTKLPTSDLPLTSRGGNKKDASTNKKSTPNQSQPSNEPKAVEVTPLVQFMFDRFLNMYKLAYKTGPSSKKDPHIKFASNTSTVQGVDVFVKSHLKLHDLAEQVHRQTINAIINNIRIDDQAFGDLYSTYFGVHGIFPGLLHTYFKTATYDPPQLTDTEQKAMFRSLVVAWAALPLEYNRDSEGTIDNAGGGKCGYISIMLSLLLNTDTFDKIVSDMLAKLTTHQTTVSESIQGLIAKKLAEQTELERAEALVAKLELQRQQALQTYQEANVVLNDLTTQLGNIFKTQNQKRQELDEFNTNLTNAKRQQNKAKRQQNEANVKLFQTKINDLRARVANLSLQLAKSQQNKDQQSKHVIQLEKQNRLASQAHRRATTQLDNQTKALRNAQNKIENNTSIANNLAIILRKLYKTPLEYRNELLGSYNVVNQVVTHKHDTPPTTCILLIMTFLYRNNKDMLEQLATSQANTQLGMNDLEKLSKDLEICCALVLPSGELNARVLKIYPPELENWWDMYDKNNTRVWIESTGSLQNKKFDGYHYVTHDFNERIEAFGRLIKPL